MNEPTGRANSWILVGALSAAIAVMTGAFAAHSLTDRFAEQYAGQTRMVAGEEIPLARKYLADFKTGAEYQMTHSLALIAVGILASSRRSRMVTSAGWCFLGGILLFSGSLYALTLFGIRVLGAITPIGGVLFLVGWVFLALGSRSGVAGTEQSSRNSARVVL